MTAFGANTVDTSVLVAEAKSVIVEVLVAVGDGVVVVDGLVVLGSTAAYAVALEEEEADSAADELRAVVADGSTADEEAGVVEAGVVEAAVDDGSTAEILDVGTGVVVRLAGGVTDVTMGATSDDEGVATADEDG
ncbi:hypothetical protein FBU31_001037, partial [Coemansia sp. 'formosensis']